MIRRLDRSPSSTREAGVQAGKHASFSFVTRGVLVILDALQPADSKASAALAVECQFLTRRFGAKDALAGVTLNVRRGEFLSVLGPAGCGKTTLLRLIAGLDLADSGGLKIAGNESSRVPPWRRPVNTIFPGYALFPHLSVSENVAFGLRLKRLPGRDMCGS